MKQYTELILTTKFGEKSFKVLSVTNEYVYIQNDTILKHRCRYVMKTKVIEKYTNGKWSVLISAKHIEEVRVI